MFAYLIYEENSEFEISKIRVTNEGKFTKNTIEYFKNKDFASQEEGVEKISSYLVYNGHLLSVVKITKKNPKSENIENHFFYLRACTMDTTKTI